MIQNINAHATGGKPVANLQSVTALTPLAKVDRAFVTVQPVTRAQQVTVQRGAAQFREFSTQRGQREAQGGQRVQAPSQPVAVPRVVPVPVPQARPAPVTTGAPARVPPARLVMPTPVPHPGINPVTAAPQVKQPIPSPAAQPPPPPPPPSPAAQPKPPPREQPPAKKGKG